jgi:hypothetical protein
LYTLLLQPMRGSPGVLLLHLAQRLDQLEHAALNHSRQLTTNQPRTTTRAAPTLRSRARPCSLQRCHCLQQLRCNDVDSWHWLQRLAVGLEAVQQQPAQDLQASMVSITQQTELAILYSLAAAHCGLANSHQADLQARRSLAM